jgi:hypothetical protein
VEVEAEGSARAVQQLREALGAGPGGATVASVDDVAADVDGLARPFSILR